MAAQDKQVVNGFFKPGDSLQKCVANLQRFTDVPFGTLRSSEKKPRLYKVRVIYLYATKSQKKYRMYAHAKGNLAAVNKEVTTFDRFLVLGIPSSPHVMTMFLKMPAATKLNLKFSQLMSPGSPLYVIMPRIVSFLSPQNPEIVSADPLIPVSSDTFEQLYTLPPADVDSPNFTWFNFASTTVEVFQANAQDNVCIGTFCDSQTSQLSCPCTCTVPEKKWVLSLTFMCSELADFARDQAVFVSQALLRVFICNDMLKWLLTNDIIDPFDLDDAVR